MQDLIDFCTMDLGQDDIRGLRQAIRILGPSMNDYLYIYDFEKDSYTLPEKAVERFCVPAAEFDNFSKWIEQFVYAEDLPILQADFADIKASPTRTSHDMLYRWLSTDGKPIWINCRGKVIRRDGKPAYVIGCINEVGRDQRADNRSGLLGTFELRKQVEQRLPDLGQGFFLRIGMDDMKDIISRAGTEIADQLTAATAAFIVQSCGEGQYAYRLDGDEFMVVDFSGGTPETAQRIYSSVQDSLCDMMIRTHYKVFLTLSAGVLSFSDVAEPSFSAIIRQTDFILGEAQRMGRNCLRFFSDEAYADFLRYRRLRLQLTSAVERNFEGFEVYYQPVYSVEHQQIDSAEALLRFHSEEYGMVSPGEFIPILEETGLIVPVGRWVMREACEACKKLQALIPGFHVSVNVSSVQIMRSPFWQDLNKIIEEVGVDPASVTCELTESEKLEQDSHVVKTSRQIQYSKVQLALDDFGSGYSNFRYLTELMPNVIKVDRVFTAKAAVDPFEFRLLSVFSEMAHTLGTELVVEGVENETELEAAYLVSADYIQGFLFSKPSPFATVYSMLEQGVQRKKNIQFPKLLYDQYFVSDVLTGDIQSIIWVNLETGDCRTMKKRTPMPLPDSDLKTMVENIRKLDIMHQADAEDLGHFLDLDYIRQCIQEGTRKLSFRTEMKVRGEFEWIRVEIMVPTTYSKQFPFIMLTWKKADVKSCLLEEAMQTRGEDFQRIIRLDLLRNRYVELTVSNGICSSERIYSERAANWFNTFAENGGIHPDDIDTYRDFIDPEILRRRLVAGEKRLTIQCRRKVDGAYRWMRMDWIRGRGFSEQNQVVMLYVLDIHDFYSKEWEERHKIEMMATTDAMTGLRNRYHFMRWCADYDSQGKQEAMGILYMDMNGLKIINDTRGHAVGDEFIRRFGRKLCKLFPEQMCVRMSGDEFMVCFPGATEEETIQAALTAKKSWAKGEMSVAAVGWAWEGACKSVDALVNQAERRMYADKRSSKLRGV